jgi:hypothetical protein
MDRKLKDEIAHCSLEELEELYYSLGEYESRPVDITTFLTDKAYLGRYFSDGLYDYWFQTLKRIYPSPYYSPYWLVSFRGAIGLGKSTIAAAGILYDLHRLLCLHSPQASYNLVESEKVVFMIFNVTKMLAEAVMWDKLTQMMQASPYFSQYFDIYKKRKREDTLFPKRIDFGIGSRIPDSLGKAVVGGALDELNFGILNQQMYNNFNSLIRRMQSRFMDEGARMPARLWIISSEDEDQSTMNQIVEQYQDDPGVLVVQESLWTVKSHIYTDFPAKSFWIFKGSDTRQPDIITAKDQAFKTNPELCIQVPERHLGAFRADIHKALRDLAGHSTGSSYKLFKLREKLTAACSVTPLFDDSFQLTFANPDDQIQGHCLMPQYFTSRMVKKSQPRYIHVDIGLTGDRFGIASSYVKSFVEQSFYDDVNMRESVELVPETVTEWAFGITPENGQEVPLYKAEAFIKWLAEQGFVIAKVTADGYQSKQLLQNLRVAGFQTEELSLDKSPEPYLELRNYTYRGLASFPANKILKREGENLQVVKTKGQVKRWAVDHPEKNPDQTKGSKDIMDAVCGSQYMARMNAHTDRGSYIDANAAETNNSELTELFWPGRN